MNPTLACNITTAITDIVAAAVGGATAAWIGLGLWRAQLRGSAEYALAKRLLLAAYRVRRELWAARKPLITSREMLVALHQLGMPEDVITAEYIRKHGDNAAYEMRCNTAVSQWQLLEEELLEATAIWGDEVRAECAALHECVRVLYRTVLQYTRRVEDGMDLTQKHELEKLLWDRGTEEEPDAFGTQINAGIAQIERLLRPHLQAKAISWPRFLKQP